MTRLKTVAGVAALAASLTLAGAAPNDEPADGLVFDAMTAPATVSYTGTVEVVSIGNQGSEASVYRIEHRAPNLTQRLYMSPPRLHGDSVVTRGERSYFVDVRRRRVLRSENDAANDQIARDDNYILLRANYRAVKQSAESFDGREVRSVALINKYTDRVTMLVRIDEQTKLVLDKQQFASEGSLVNEVRFENVRYASDIADADFNLPKDFAAVRGPTFGEPSKDGHMIDVKSVPTLQLLYSDGIRTVSLFENTGDAGVDLQPLHPQPASISGHAAHYAEQGPNMLLTWTDGPLHFALVGDLRIEELRRIAASLEP
jgi:negative regulator of sigma E activity